MSFNNESKASVLTCNQCCLLLKINWAHVKGNSSMKSGLKTQIALTLMPSYSNDYLSESNRKDVMFSLEFKVNVFDSTCSLLSQACSLLLSLNGPQSVI